MKFEIIFLITAIFILSGCGVDPPKKLDQATSFNIVDCRFKSANTIKVEGEKIMLVYDPNLDKRDGCKN